MADSVIKMRRRPVGIKHQDVYKNQSPKPTAGTKAEMPSKEKVMNDARLIKQLEDRIAILEMELQRAHEQSFQAGFDEGKQRTLKEAENRVQAAQLEKKEQEIKFVEAIEQMDKPLLDIAKKVALQVVKTHLELSGDTEHVLMERLRGFLYEIIEESNIIIEVNPTQKQLLQQKNSKEQLGLADNSDVKVIGNPELQPGEAHITTDNYFVDGTFENQIDKIHGELGKETNK